MSNISDLNIFNYIVLSIYLLKRTRVMIYYGFPSATDVILRVFAQLLTNHPKALDSRSLASTRPNRGLSLQMPNMLVHQRTSAASIRLDVARR